MKKLTLFLFGIGSLFALSVSAATYSSDQPVSQYQEQPAPCFSDTVCNQLPCNVPAENVPCAPVPCNNDSVCSPVPCAPAPCVTDTVCTPAPCAPAPVPCGC